MKVLLYRALLLLVFIAGCTSLAISMEEKMEVTGEWEFNVVGIDYLKLYTGVVRISQTSNGTLQGRFSSIASGDYTVRNLRYKNGRLTFTIRNIPGSIGGTAFSLDVIGNTFRGVAYTVEDSFTASFMGSPANIAESVEIVGHRK